jgi:hypothetical protein
MAVWKGIVGRGFTPGAFLDYVATLSFSDWRPQFVVVHNTSEPRLSQWHTTPGEQRMRNLESYYRDQQGWSAGPHLFIADDLIWVFTPLTTAGVHSPSWNAIAWGVEMVGEYEEEPFSPAVRDNTVAALAALHAWRGIAAETLRFHKEDPRTQHTTCPGRNADKADLIARVEARMRAGAPGEHLPGRPPGDAQPQDSIVASAPVVQGPAADGSLFTNITATEFGGGEESGSESAYGGRVDPASPQVALPARLAEAKRRVRVRSVATNRSVDCLVNDIGPWNTDDPYWEKGARPLAEAQHRDRTKAQNGSVPTNDAGIDLTPAVFAALGIAGPVNTRQTHVDWTFV